jgi:hypothetical protein
MSTTSQSGVAPSLTSTPHPSTRLPALDRMFSGFTAPPLPKVDRFAAIRAAKAAKQGGRQQHRSHPLPSRPAPARLLRPTVRTSAHQPATPMSSSAGGSPSGGVGVASGSSGGGSGGVTAIGCCRYCMLEDTVYREVQLDVMVAYMGAATVCYFCPIVDDDDCYRACVFLVAVARLSAFRVGCKLSMSPILCLPVLELPV